MDRNIVYHGVYDLLKCPGIDCISGFFHIYPFFDTIYSRGTMNLSFKH